MTNKISAGTIARTVVLLLALVNQVLSMLGVQTIPIADEDINTLIATGWTRWRSDRTTWTSWCPPWRCWRHGRRRWRPT